MVPFALFLWGFICFVFNFLLRPDFLLVYAGANGPKLNILFYWRKIVVIFLLVHWARYLI